MLTKADDYPIHQTPDPVAHPGADRNFYDRFFFCGWSADGKTYLAAAMGLYPNLDLIDAAFSITHVGVQHSVFASRILNSERLDIHVGPFRIEIIEPLNTMRFVVEDNEHGIAADFTFHTLLPPIEEERHHMRHGTRTIFELTRMSIFGRYEGWAAINGDRIELSSFSGVRDRSWGVRNIGARDPQPMIPPMEHQAFWIWSPILFEDRALMFVELEGANGHVAKRRAEFVSANGVETLQECAFEAIFDSKTRRARSVRISGRSAKDGFLTIDAVPTWSFQLVGVGYDHPSWLHGTYHGPLATHGEKRILAELDPRDRENIHIHAPATAILRFEDGRTMEGRGSVEQLIYGDHGHEGLGG